MKYEAKAVTDSRLAILGLNYMLVGFLMEDEHEKYAHEIAFCEDLDTTNRLKLALETLDNKPVTVPLSPNKTDPPSSL